MRCVREFREVYEKKSMPLLYLFIERYKNSDLKEISRFANGLEKDIEAVENSTASELSNGFVEGTNSKLKMVKRTMYGRCSVYGQSRDTQENQLLVRLRGQQQLWLNFKHLHSSKAFDINNAYRKSATNHRLSILSGRRKKGIIMSMDRERIIWLDYARTIAIICVVITHTVQRIYDLSAESLLQSSVSSRIFALSMFSIGRLGVPSL